MQLQKQQIKHQNDAAKNCPTDQICCAECMVDAMDQIPVQVHGHCFHHSQIMQALKLNAAQAHAQAANAVAEHDGHTSSTNVGCANTHATL